MSDISISQTETNTLTRGVIHDEIELVKTIYYYGGRPNVIENESNTLLKAISHGNIELIRLVCSY